MEQLRKCILSAFRCWLHALLDVVFPRSCVITGKALAGGELKFVSEDGAKKLCFIHAENACSRCGCPVAGSVDSVKICKDCLNRGDDELQAECSRSVVRLDRFSRPIVFSLKYWKHPAIARDMATLAKRSRGFVEHLSGAVLVPVPLYKKRFRWRGYNQSLYLAKAFAEIAPGARVEDLLERMRDTGTQTRLDADERRKNVRKAFVLKKGAKLNPLERYVLIDDVFTTGATLSECARALRIRGAVKIDAATFAHG